MARSSLDLCSDAKWRAKVARHRRKIARLRDALRVVATAIHRNRDMNACWLAGEAIHVHAVEDALGPTRRQPSVRLGGMVREAILKALKQQKQNRYWLWKESGVPRSVAYDGLDGTRPIPLEHAEAMMKTLGLTVTSKRK